jgi:hypothetical protein
MPSLLKGKPVASGPCLVDVLTYPLPLQQILVPLMSSCGYMHRFVQEGWRERHVAPQEASGEVTTPKTMQTCD